MGSVLMIAVGVTVFLAICWIGARLALDKIVPPEAM